MSAIRLGTPLNPVVNCCLQWKRALGRRYFEVEHVLVSLLRFMHGHAATDPDQELFDGWSQSFAELSANVRRNRQPEARNFCRYRQRTEPSCFVPVAHRFPRPRPYCAPAIYGPDAVAQMLFAVGEQRATPGSPLLPAVLRLAIVLLYTAGLRRGELPRLILADADPFAGGLRIHESKFHKSRLVPLSADACEELRTYLRQRLAAPLSTALDTPLLCNCKGGLRGYTGTGLSRGLQLLIRSADVKSADGGRPRNHDFRHSFAVQALVRWYRQDADVQSNLPKLAMHMGHVSIVSTAYYLKWMPDIAAAASDRFEKPGDQPQNGIATSNARLAALHTFARFLASEAPEHHAELQRVLGLPFKRGGRNTLIEYLESAEVEALLQQIDQSTAAGRRDYALFAQMLDTGARVQEILDLKLCDVRTELPHQVRLHGKGGKVRLCPI